MMTWMTRKSILDTAADLETDHLQLCIEEADIAFNTLVYGYAPEEGNGADFSPSHPLYKMWTGYEIGLAGYIVAFSLELTSRGVRAGFSTSTRNTVKELRSDQDADGEFILPPWTEDEDVLRSHRSNLVRRWPKEYGATWKGTPESWPYIWAFVDENGGYDLMVSKSDKALLANGERELPKRIKERIQNL